MFNVNKAFNENDGLIAFLKKTLKFKKLFKASNIKTFQLLQKIIENENKAVEQYAKSVLQVNIRS